MSTTDRILQETVTLPEAQQAEVLDFIGYLKSRGSHSGPKDAHDREARVERLRLFFAPYRKDPGEYRFDRDEANAR